MKAHIITIGDEILIGQTLNTNAAYIGERLSNINIDVRTSSVVGDDEGDILKEFDRCWKKNDLLVVTGGLGPTHDDITRKCIIKFFKTELIQNNDVLEDIKFLFEKRKREVTKVNVDQALVPKIAKVIRNSRGTAPGAWIEKDNKIFIVMPGVPSEMEKMMTSYVIPNLKEKLGVPEFTILRKTIYTTGIPESTLFEKLGDIEELLNGAGLAFLPSIFGVKLRITVKEKDEETAKNKLSEVEQKIISKAGRYIYSRDEEALEAVIGKLLKDRNLKLAVAESCTGGYVSNVLTNISGSSEYFERGIISYSNASKVEILRVNEDTLAEYGAVSIEVARQMADGVKSIAGADIGLAITGIMGPGGATAGKPVGLVYISVCDDKVCTAKEFRFGEDRLLNKQRTSQAALEMLRRHILGITQDE
ncbi:MAG: competence/damage-inducible protein A [Ignavibacteria bacterium RBG_16_34_14]|nr:MAG: competence/damage-inducible protein A [Ignavibacteria bacterium RBG_16_34_14]